MKKATSLFAIIFTLSFMWGGGVHAQYSIGEDDASAYNGTWSDTDDHGYGFGGWAFGGNAAGRVGIASSAGNGGATTIDVNGDSFWLSDVDNSGNYIDVFRYLTEDLQVGQTFSIDMDVNWRGGWKGIRVRDADDSTPNFRFEIGNPGGGDDHVVYDAATGNGSIGDAYSDDTIFTISLEQTSASGGTWTITRSGGISDSDAGTYTGRISSFQLYTSGAGSDPNQAIYYNNLEITSSEASVQLNGSAGYRLLSAPSDASLSSLLGPIWTQGATGADVSDGNPNVFTWDKGSTGDSNADWSGVTDLTNTNITAGNGVLVYVFHDDGAEYALPKSLTVSGTENAVDTSPVLNSNANGWTLVGNPFASTIDFDNTTKNQLTDVAYVWDVNDAGGDAGTDPLATGSWKSWNGTAGDLTDGLIKPFQGFFVQNGSTVGSEELTFSESSKSSGGIFYGKMNEPKPAARLVLQGEGVRNTTWLQFSENGAFNEPIKGDALELKSLNENYAQLGVVKADGVFDIAHLTSNKDEYTFPLYVETTNEGAYTLSADNFEIPEEMTLFLHDEQTGVKKQITDQFEYEFELSAAKEKSTSPLYKNTKEGLTVSPGSSESRFTVTATLNTTTGGIEEIETPFGFQLKQNYPNPFNPVTNIEYAVPKASEVKLAVYDLLGREVAVLINGYKASGSYTVRFDASSLSSGVYIYRLFAGTTVINKKLTLIK